ncbi:hypothetical protein BKA61DRAFT_341098 [Leptodontidium sp. MPI-SDFR-AT-0119]|nr:hypothetical protein BKA61DRAFT_341098 [Leptodontidium sp. MPI-SDFR-AT-0119]
MSCPGSEMLEGINRSILRRDYDGSIYANRDYTYMVFFGGAQIAMIAVATILVIFCALLTGLTLAVCGLDMNYLQLRSVTGCPQERRQAQEVIRMKRRANWMLCSLILCSVACSQTFPFVIQSVWHGPQFWVPILISTLTMTIFVEIIPQYLIPQQAIAWGYYCWPVIWGCMWTTCLVTYPLGWLLDKSRTKKDRVGIFTNDELQAVIQYHEQSEKRGGKLGQDAARIMLGALKLDSQRLAGYKRQPPQPVRNEKDIEKADSIAGEGIIVKWDAAKTVDIDDTVDEAFIKKVLGWSYSRIPVTGRQPGTNNGKGSETEGWEGYKVFGFLHVRNIIGIDTKTPAKAENKLRVKDLTIYPLPIVRADMSVYELLNLFQLGMSRMAIVVRESSAESNGNTGSTLWTVTERTNTHLTSNLKTAKGKSHWTMDYLKFAQAAAINPDYPRQNVLGIECPKPLGIITFEDIIDTILQKTSRDERDFFDRDCSCPPTKTKKIGDYSSKLSALIVDQNLPRSPKKAHVTFEKSVNPGTMRKRKISNKVSGPSGLDGADDRSFDGYSASSIRLPKNRRKSTGSSYADNSGGGFHGANESGNAMDHTTLMTPEEIIELANTSSSDCLGNPYSHVKTASLPTRRSDCAISEDSKGHGTVSAGTRLPQLRRVAPFSRDNPSSFEREVDDQEGDEMTELTMPLPLMAPGPFYVVDLQLRYNPNLSGIDIEEMEDSLEPVELQSHVRQKSGETVSLMSWSSDDDAHQMACVYDAFPVPAGEINEPSVLPKILEAITMEKEQTKPYDGFPPELLDITNKDNRLPDYASKTLPRSTRTELNLEDLAEKTSDAIPPAREGSFHDDRAMLPSQRRLLENSSNGFGTRSSSLWF